MSQQSTLANNLFLVYALAFLIICELLFLVISGLFGNMGGLEMADIAERLVLGQGFSSPYLPLAEGKPTSVSPPLYVWLMSGVYTLFGIKSELSHACLQLLNIVFNSITLLLLYRICQTSINELTARIFALLFALHPHILLITSNIWETGLSLMLLSTMLWYANTRYSIQQPVHSAILGLLMGLTALSNPAWTICYPIICFVLVWPRVRHSKKKWQSPMIALFIIIGTYLSVVSPWLIRNYQTSGEIMYIRNMAGPELFKGNHRYAGGGHGVGFSDYWIYKSKEEQDRYRTMGEPAYDQWMKRQAVEQIKNDPAHYIMLVLHRIGMWWSGDIDALIKWYEEDNIQKFLFGVVLTIAGAITTGFALWGSWMLRSQSDKLWLVWVYAYFLPIPYYMIIIGFRYQASLIPFTLIPVAYSLAIVKEKLTAIRPGNHDITARIYPTL